MRTEWHPQSLQKPEAQQCYVTAGEGDLQQGIGLGQSEAPFQLPRRNAADDLLGRNVPFPDRPGTDDCPGAASDPGQQSDTLANPDIISQGQRAHGHRGHDLGPFAQSAVDDRGNVVDVRRFGEPFHWEALCGVGRTGPADISGCDNRIDRAPT